MERLTDNYDYCFLTCYEHEGDLCGEECPWYKNCHERLIFERLKHYEDLEEQGRLIELPCKVGDIVWRIATQHNNYDDSPYKIVMQSSFRLDYLNEMGKTVFLTKEEAEAKLKELKGK